MAGYETTKRRDYDYRKTRGIGRGCFGYLENMYIDYGGGADAVESIVGYRRMARIDRGIHSFATVTGDGEGLVIHSTNNLYLAVKKEGESNLSLRKIAELEDRGGSVISLGEVCIITDGKRMLWADGYGNVGTVSCREDIAGCRCATLYDGRLVLSGNESLPHRVFISNGITEDGTVDFCHYDEVCGMNSVISLVAMDGYLLILTSSSSEGEIIYRKSVGPDTDRNYTVERTVNKLPPFTAAREFHRTLTLMTREGIISIDPFYDSITPILRSEKITPMLLSEEGKGRMTEWMGYLVLNFGDSMYLADDRCGDGWDWYFISGIGGYVGDKRAFRYLDHAKDGCLVHPHIDRIAEGEVYSCGSREGMIYYSKEGNKCYAVYPTAEMYGGELLPPKQIMGCGSLLWFCTEEGVYLFNNDKRGRIPDDILFAENSPGYDAPIEADKIHPLYYSFAGHTPTYTAITDVGDRTGEETIIEIKKLGDGDISITDLTSGNPARKRIISTRGQKNVSKKGENDAKSHTRPAVFTTVRLSGRRQGVTAGGLCISTNQPASPFGISSISYVTKTGKENKK